jgi:hypothetical protein
MNSLERVLTALKREEPDKVPVVELDIDDAIIQEIMPGASWLDFCEHFDIDGVMVMYEVQFEEVETEIKRDFFGVFRNFKEMQGWWPTPVEPIIKGDMDPNKFLETYKMSDSNNTKIFDPLRAAVKRLKGKRLSYFAFTARLYIQSSLGVSRIICWTII